MAKAKKKVIGKDETKKENLDPKELAKKEMLKLEETLLNSVNQTEQDLVSKAKRSFQAASDSRRKYDWEWLSRDLFRRGYQFTRYNSSTKTVTMAVTQTAKIPVNLTTAALRSISNQVTAFKPKWEALPNRLDDESKDNARYSGKYLDYVFKRMRLKKKTKETVKQGLLFSVGGAWQIGWDKNAINEDGSKGFLYIWLVDPFDFYVDSNCTDGLAFTDAEYLIKAVRHNVHQVRANTMYKNRELVRPDNKAAASEYKQFLLQSIKMVNQYDTIENESVIIYEGWFKERDEKTGKVKMRRLTWTEGMSVPLFNEVYNIDDFPFRMYQADMNPLEVYGEGWAKHVIPINRVINVLESSEFDYNYKFNRGRIVIDKNSGINFISNLHGTIIEKNRGAQVGTLPLQPLTSSSQNQIIRMRQYFEDISGAHDVTLGRIPAGVKSGIGIAELKQADATNQDDLVDNLEDFLIEVARKCLKVTSENITFPRLVKATNIAGDADYFAIVGEKSARKRKKSKIKIGKKEYPLVVIASDNTITVQIGSWLAYSKQQRQQELKDLYTTGVIDQRTLLEHLEFGDIEQIIDRTRQEAIIKKRREVQEVGSSTEVTEEELAMAENNMLLEGNTDVMAQPKDAHEVHITIHKEQRDNNLVKLHIEEHEALLRQQENIPEGDVGQQGPQQGPQPQNMGGAAGLMLPQGGIPPMPPVEAGPSGGAPPPPVDLGGVLPVA